MSFLGRTALLGAALAVSCTESPASPPEPATPREPANPKPVPPERQCADASERTGGLACLHRLADAAAWQSISVTLPAVDQGRSAKYLFPARDDARLLPLFMNSARWELHYDFMVEAFGDLFATLTPPQYLDLLFSTGEREYYAGALTEYREPSGQTALGVTIVGDPSQPGTVTCEDVRVVHAGLAARVFRDELKAVPSDTEQLGFFADCGVPVLDPTALEYEPYHQAKGCGTLRLYTTSALARAAEAAQFGFRDIVVLDQAPGDIDTVVAGAVTGTRQAPLSHLAVRSASRGTPNCYLKDAHEYLAPWQDQLVCIECASRQLLVRAASDKEAATFWAELRPPPVAIPEPDRTFTDLVVLEALPTGTPEARATGTARFGGKGRNLAWLRQNMSAEFTPPGFLIPVAHYLEFVEQGRWKTDLGGGLAEHSFAETLASWFDDPAFSTDARLRRDRLLALQKAFERSTCAKGLLDQVARHIVEVFGAATTTVRFRSSSNAEDGVFFSGAGLYDSLSGCLADDLDADAVGPSACDPEEPNERGVCRALKKVWASLWNPKAYDEREFFGIDPRRVAMGVLVNERSELERANMVAFSGNPVAARDMRYLVNAQTGELPVVSPEPGMRPEQVLLEVAEGRVVTIERVASSSELEAGEQVLTDAQLRVIGQQLSQLAAVYPFDAKPPLGHRLLIDTEWKVMPDGSVRVKQIRPFLE